MGSVGDDRVVIVTGAVSGIGKALTEDFVARGRQVVGFDVQDALGEILEEKLGERFHYIHCDVSSYEEQAAAFQETFDKFGRIDVFCHNAGLIDQSSIYNYSFRGKKEIPPAPMLGCSQTCYFGLIYGTQLAIHFMRQNPTPGGCIAATGSSIGLHPIASMPQYCGIKAAINAFVRSTAPVLKLKDNIRINCINPGIVATRNIPEPMRVSFDGYITPVSVIVDAYNQCLNDDSLNGELLECSVDRISQLPEPPYWDGERLKKTTTNYEGLFMALHGEKSDVPGSVQ